jgi:hypothetical protein
VDQGSAGFTPQEQEQESKSPVLFFLMPPIITANDDSHALVQDWMVQLLDYSPHLQA